MKAILIEDEANVRAGFKKMIGTFCPQITVINEADSVESGLRVIKDSDFDVLFLDINLPDGSGFDLLYSLKERNFKVIFVTAYDQYALDAFKVSAHYYLMKPVSPDELKKAIAEIQLETNEQSDSKLQVLEERISDDFQQKEKIILKDLDAFHIILIRDIIYCKAEGSYTTFKTTDNSYVISTNLKEYERILGPYGFERSHHSYLINIAHIKALNKADNTILLLNGELVPFSSRKKHNLLEALKHRYIG